MLFRKHTRKIKNNFIFWKKFVLKMSFQININIYINLLVILSVLIYIYEIYIYKKNIN
jgi:hypothetical protein